MNILRGNGPLAIATFGVALSAVTGAFGQLGDARSMYAAAKPYMYESIPSLKLDVHDLSGLKPDESQAGLQAVLDNASAVIIAQMPRVPNLLAREDIAQEQRPATSYMPGGMSSGSGRHRQDLAMQPVGPQDDRLVPHDWRRFEYLIIAKPDVAGTIFDESRVEVGKPRDLSPPHGIGFGSMWMMFLPTNLPESHFRYIGRQKIDGRPTFVVVFAQDPELVKMPAVIQLESGSFPLLYQGVAWIDQETYRMVRIRTDLLAPLPTVQVKQVSSSVNFSEVKIPQLETPLWLPKDVEITWEISGTRLGEIHRYSGYHLFRATSRIVPE